jgi:tetratricopeptide (TPR) repeat protein
MRLHGELDWIVMKAMEKDRAKRYDSAAAFAADIENHLASLPVRAGAPSRLLQLRKFVRRNRRPAALITAAVMTLAAGFVGTTIGLIGQSRLREQAERERDETQAQRRQAQANLAEALFNGGEFARAEAEFRALLRPPEHGPAATAEQEANWLGYIARSIDEQRRGMLRARADAAFLAWLESKGVAPTAAGGSVSPAMNGDEPPALEVVEQAYDAAIAALRRVYSPGDTRIADIVLRKAYALRDFGRPAEAEPFYREAMMSYLALTPPDHIANGEIIVALANDLWRLHRHQEAAALYDQAIAEYKLGPRDRQWRIGSARLYRAENLVALGRFSEAESDLGEVEQRFSGTGDGYQECAQGYAELYRAWDAAEPGRGHDQKARAWEMKILPNLSTFKKAITQPIERWPDK